MTSVMKRDSVLQHHGGIDPSSYPQKQVNQIYYHWLYAGVLTILLTLVVLTLCNEKAILTAMQCGSGCSHDGGSC